MNHKEIQDLSTISKALKQILQVTDTKNEDGSKPLVLTVKDAAEELQVSIPTVRDHFLCRPDFPKIRAGTKILIPRKAFEEWINGQS
jgi:excisionase family DNA binding protein